jgi:hypothetical protein
MSARAARGSVGYQGGDRGRCRAVLRRCHGPWSVAALRMPIGIAHVAGRPRPRRACRAGSPGLRPGSAGRLRANRRRHHRTRGKPPTKRSSAYWHKYTIDDIVLGTGGIDAQDCSHSALLG